MKQRRTYGQHGHIPLLVAMLLVVSGVPASTAQPPAPSSGIAGDTTGPAEIRGLDQPLPERNPLDDVRKGAEETEGTIFVQPDQVVVKPPLLKALIQLQAGLSPYALDADSGRGITLERVLKTALANNLTIKISNTDQQSSKWLYYSALGSFLPSLVNAVSYQMISGKFSSPFGLRASVDTADLVIPNTINWTFFQGGGILFSALKNKHLYRASQYALKGTINDVLYEAVHLYYQLALHEALLQIRIKAVETSQALLMRNQDLYDNGVNTKLDVLQARTQLSRDRQSLIEQQIARRKAAIRLATALNFDPGVDLLLENRLIKKIRLVDPNLKIGELLQIAIDNRPELKQYEQLRLAARDAVKVAFAPLLPQVVGSAGAAMTAARVQPSGASTQSAATGAAFGAASFSPTSTAAAAQSAGGRKFTPSEIFLIGLSVQWQVGGMGVTDMARVQAAKWQARKAQLQFSKELNDVYQQVRDAYLDSIDAENLINETTDAVNSSRDEFEVATIRLAEGVGTDLDAVHALRDYTQALTDKANAIIKFNTAQARLLQSIGRISYDSLTSLTPLSR